MSELKTISGVGVTEILGRDIVFYGTWEEPLFLGRDVANWIEHTNPSKLVNNVDEDEKLVAILPITNSYTQDNTAHGGLRENTQAIFLTEDGLYETLMQSRKPIAKELRRKIKQYLKQIRKTGGTVEDGREEEFINKYFPSFSDKVKLSMVQDLLKTNRELKPKADYHDKVLRPDRLATVTDIAKDLGMSAVKLNSILHDRGVQFKQGKSWKLYAKYEHLVPEYADYHIHEHGQILKWKEAGRKWIIELLEDENK